MVDSLFKKQWQAAYLHVSVALLPHPADCFTSFILLSKAGSAAQPADGQHKRVQLELPRLLGKALLLLRPELPGQGGPPQTPLQQRCSHIGKRHRRVKYSGFELFTTWRGLCSCRRTPQMTPSLKPMSKLRSTCSA